MPINLPTVFLTLLQATQLTVFAHPLLEKNDSGAASPTSNYSTAPPPSTIFYSVDNTFDRSELVHERDEISIISGANVVEVSGKMSIDKILEILGSRGCKNVTDKLDPSSESFGPVGGFGELYRMNICDDMGTRCVCVKCLKPLIPPGTLLKCFQLADAVAYLHSQGVVHADIKGANILVSRDNKPKLADFGSATLKEYTIIFSSMVNEISVTLRWMAPEIFIHKAGHSVETDIYALGMTILEIITGELPYGEISNLDVLACLVNKVAPERPTKQIPFGSGKGDTLWSMLLKCWGPAPEDRPPATEIRDTKE
ncbi:hypothetical protein RSOLAG22IIIB_13127 [Rhizoctonia solani]|uniref:Protein kinase domain-containing protein n=1 Tax=Rhizoctonia solani TaxID=456999 RepID=A0A0K6GIZ3_9AGAM|nr:hypothetical protein RSOLAG22IIIB_13127 [Rhizoctonia solani]